MAVESEQNRHLSNAARAIILHLYSHLKESEPPTQRNRDEEI